VWEVLRLQRGNGLRTGSDWIIDIMMDDMIFHPVDKD
jgi:hypothetical protein